jgi:hypothetical protein
VMPTLIDTGSNGGIPGGGGGGGGGVGHTGGTLPETGLTPGGGGGGGYQGGNGADNNPPSGDRMAKGGACQYYNAAPYQVTSINTMTSPGPPIVEITYTYNSP